MRSSLLHLLALPSRLPCLVLRGRRTALAPPLAYRINLRHRHAQHDFGQSKLTDLLSSEDLRSSRISCGPSAPSDVIVAARLHVYRSHPLIPLHSGRRRGRRLALSALGGLGSLRQPCARQLCLLQFVSLVSVDRCAAQSFRTRNVRGQSTSDRGRAA